MSKIKIIGGNKLTGKVKISGAKNSAVALIPAAILCDEEVTIDNIPNISDIKAIEEILQFLNVTYSRTEESITINSRTLINKPIPTDIAQKIRASYYFMGALLGRDKHISISLPGGCQIGARPINLHLLAFEKLGAKVINNHGTFDISASRITGTDIYLEFASVGATINIMLASVKAHGVTTIENAALEPEIVNVANFLNAMGAKIYGAGTGIIKITGVDYLKSCHHEVIPDRIEAGTYAIIASIMGENVVIENIIPNHLLSVITKLKETGAKIKIEQDSIIVSKADALKSANIKTQVYPGFPTDLQQPMTALLTQCDGMSIVEETIYENRFQNVEYLNKMGASIDIEGKIIRIHGKTSLQGCDITSTDLRAGSCLIIAALLASGETLIDHTEHVLRGYEDIDVKLQQLGAKIEVYK